MQLSWMRWTRMRRDPAVLASTRAGIASLGAGFATPLKSALRRFAGSSKRHSSGCARQDAQLYATPWLPLFGFEGEAFSKGGYLNRGFGSLRWLPDVPLESSGPLPGRQ
jgi:hypothetical protein